MPPGGKIPQSDQGWGEKPSCAKIICPARIRGIEILARKSDSEQYIIWLVESQLKPAQRKDRIDVLDALRGLAVFGMFMINIRVFSGYAYYDGESKSNFLLAGMDAFFDRLHIVLFSGKFYTLFALLFGIGFAMQIVRASSGDHSFILHFSRRLFFLLLIGTVHLWGIWFSDILVFYALCGYLLLLFRGLTDRGLVWSVIFLLLIPGFHAWYLYVTDGGYTNILYEWVSDRWMANNLPQASAGYHSFRMEDIAAVIRDGSWNTVLKFNSIGPLIRIYIIAYDIRIIKILAIFVLGFWIGRNIINHNLHNNRVFLRNTAITGFLAGLPLNIYFAMDVSTRMDESYTIASAEILNTFGYISLTSAYAATFALLYQAGLRKFLDWSFNSVGKTALSNYLLQSLIGIILFYSAGLGLGEYFGSTMLTIAVIAIFGLQILISNIWLSYFRFGPVEWIWRVLTYGQYIKNKLQ